MQIFIMCGGKQRRWNGPGLKQMAEIHGRPIVHRTLDQVGCGATIVASPDQYADIVGDLEHCDTELCDSSATDLWCEGFLATKPLWGDDNVCILGDVWFTDEAMRNLISARGLHVMGRGGQSPYTGGPGETFALTWNKDDADMLEGACLAAIDHARSHDSTTGYDALGCPLGTPWQPYRYLAGFHPEQHKTDDEIWIEQNDWTDDVDDYQRYKKLKRRLEAQFPV